MYTLGIIGGMGSLATAQYFERLVLKTPAKNDREHINTIILNHATLPDRTSCILNQDGGKFLKAIKPDFDIMNKIGVKAIALPCNTSHYYYDEFNQYTDIPIINMIDKTMETISRCKFKKACVFATEGTLSAKVYEKYAAKYDIDIISLSNEERSKVMEIIYSIKATNKIEEHSFNDLISQHCDKDTIGIIACTELSLIPITKENKAYTIDALDVLVRESISYHNY